MTDTALLQYIADRLDTITGGLALLISFAVSALVIWLLYRCIDKFITY